MNNIQKISDITNNDIAEYIRLTEPTQDDLNYLSTILGVAKNYIMSYTGIKEENLDNYQDIVIVVFVLCQDMFDNRALYVDNNSPNKVVETILGMHQVNLL